VLAAGGNAWVTDDEKVPTAVTMKITLERNLNLPLPHQCIKGV
jgi:hypothetical protein